MFHVIVRPVVYDVALLYILCGCNKMVHLCFFLTVEPHIHHFCLACFVTQYSPSLVLICNDSCYLFVLISLVVSTHIILCLS